MTVTEFWQYSHLPENDERRLDLLRGEVIEWERGYRKHGIVCTHVGCLLHEYADFIELGYATLGNAGIIFPKPPASVLGPDVCYFTAPITDGKYGTGWDDSLPVIAAEVHSPNHPRKWEMAKIMEYLRHEVPFVWSIDPELQSLVVYRSDGPVLYQASDVVSLDVIPGKAPLRFEVRNLFLLPAERGPNSLLLK